MMEQSQNTLPAGIPDEEMSLGDLGRILCAGWRIIFVSVVMVLVAAGIFLAITPRQYEATLVIRIGQTGKEEVGMAGRVGQIESSDYTANRMRTPDFMNAVLESLGSNDYRHKRLFEQSYQVKVLSPESNYLKISVYGFTPEDAKRAAQASLAVLVDIHRNLVKRMEAVRENRFANIVADIADTEDFLNSVKSLECETSSNSGDCTFKKLEAVNNSRKRLRDLHLQESLMKEAMSPDVNRPTMAAGPVSVLSQPVHPKVHRVWVFAIFAGILLGVFLVSLRSIHRMNMIKKGQPQVGQKQKNSK